MNDIAIRVDGLSKQYRIGLEEERDDTLAGALASWVRSPVQRYKRLRRLSHFKQEEGDDIIWALRDVSFEVYHNEVVGIIGRNGAGKSTLLKILSRVTEPTEGKVEIQGRVSCLLEVGTGFHPELTGRENVYLNGAVLGMGRSEVDAKFDEIVAFSGVEKFIDTPIKRYSSGMKVRLAFSVAAHVDPDILIIDEVLAVGDLEFQQRCIRKMESIADEGRTVLFTSHNMRMVENFCDRTILLEDGQVLANDATGQVLGIYYDIMREEEVNERTGLDDTKYRRGGGEARFTKILIRDTQGTERNKFYPGETVCFKLTYQVFEELEGLDIGVQLRSGGTREQLTGVRYAITEGRLPVGHQETVLIELPDIPFRPGTYRLYFGLSVADETRIHSGKRRPYDIVDDLTAPLIVLAQTEEEKGLAGFIGIESRMHRTDLVEK